MTSGSRVLTLGNSSAHFDLQDGARLTSLTLGGHALLVEYEHQEPMWWGAFVMAPWTSLLRGGAFECGGQRHLVTAADSDDAWHGVVRSRSWRLRASTDQQISAATDLGAPWPLGGEATLEAMVSEHALSLRLGISAHTCRMPASVGWHPWFRRRLDMGDEVDLRVGTDALVQERDTDERPTGRWVPPTHRWNGSVRNAGPVDLVYPGAGVLRVGYSSEYVTLFTSHPQGVCVEPVTSPAERMDHTLEPGGHLSLDVRLEWTEETSGND